MGETLAGLQTELGRAGRLRDRHPRRPRADRGDPAGHRGPGRLHGQPERGRGRPALHRAGAGRDQAQRPVAERPRLARGSPASFGGGGHRAAAGATLPEPIAESVERVLDAVRKPRRLNRATLKPRQRDSLPERSDRSTLVTRSIPAPRPAAARSRPWPTDRRPSIVARQPRGTDADAPTSPA